MYCINDDANTPGFEDALNTICNLCRQFFLHLQAPGKSFDNPCEFADADDFLVGQVANMCNSDYRGHVVFAMRLERNITQHDQFIVAIDFLERPLQKSDRVLSIPPEPVVVCQGDPFGCINQAFAFWIIAGPA